ncbi:hypothetical protein Glove_243g29 [Diversispora epigaea]|uniref:Endonuclease/exonuclease/phosphatase domain-containing protein n=1 Tax=Diversispora epigaea TaxID=1348612 RepID=A0A397IBF0_9GLOM|nr:hypothetical protein Glove_243g29 [Diversispora epigaea]
MSEQEDRPRRKVVNYSSTRSPTTKRNRFKFNPLDNKNNNKNLGKKTTKTSSVPQGETYNTGTQEWQQVTNRKGKQKVVDNDTTSKNQETTVVEDNKSIISFEDINENQHEWRETFGTKKYKIWTFASRIPEKMNTAKKINVSADVAQPSYMHRAVIFKRNSQRDIMHELAFEIFSTFGDIERTNFRTNDMWQSAVIVFKEKNSAEKILENWSILIVMTHLVTSLNFTAEMLKSRGKFTAKVIGLPNGITARELIPTIEKVRAKTCYFPRTRTSYRRRGEAIVSFVFPEIRDAALNTSWTDENTTTTIKVVDFTTKTCHRCYSIEHLISNCPLTKRDAEFKEKKVNSLEKFGVIYKKYNPRYLATLNRQTGNTTYADIAREVSDRLTALEEHVWNKTNADLEQDSFDSDNDIDMDEDSVEPESSNPSINISGSSSDDRLINVINQLVNRLDNIESRVMTPADNNNNNNNSSINSNLSGNSNKTSEKTTSVRSNIFNTENYIDNQHIYIATHNVRGFNDPIKRQIFFNFIKTKNADIVGISETNIKENGEKWFIEGSSKYRIHWSSMGMGLVSPLL